MYKYLYYLIFYNSAAIEIILSNHIFHSEIFLEDNHIVTCLGSHQSEWKEIFYKNKLMSECCEIFPKIYFNYFNYISQRLYNLLFIFIVNPENIIIKRKIIKI